MEPPSLIGFIFFFSIAFSSSFPLIRPSFVLVDSASLPLELISLLSLKSSLRDPLGSFHDWDPSPVFSKRNFQEPIWCTWSGVGCDPKTSRVTSLDLSLGNLSGSIPREVRYLSASLLHLNLSRNSFEGPLQPALFELTQLRTLDVSHNSFNSTFPSGASQLRFLEVLDAYSNSFTGPLPLELTRLQLLEYLNLGGSYFQGIIPPVYGSFPRLKSLYLQGNLLEGPIPPQLGLLSRLEHLEIGYNNYDGNVPAELSYLSNLNYLDIATANLSGSLPQGLGNLTMLDTLLLFKNRLTGEIPSTFARLRALKFLDLSNNELSSSLPEWIGSLQELTILSLMNNNLSGDIPESLGELPNLDTLNLWNNSLTGILPPKLGSRSKLLKLDVSSNLLTGPIPPYLCLGNRLGKLMLFSNRFENRLPQSLATCASLSRLRIQNNRLNGTIPQGLGLLQNLTYIDLSNNDFSGTIPPDLGNSIALQYLNISGNSFGSTLPVNIWNSPNLQVFSASSAMINGPIPDFIGCRSVYRIELAWNMINGTIPWDIGHCEKLLTLNLSHNSLTGIIPWEISSLSSITDVDLSHNLLTGTIPSNFDNCTTLESFNVSFNLLTGPIPSSSSLFRSLHPSSFYGNEGLCGEILVKPCDAHVLGATATGDVYDQAVHRQQPRHYLASAGAIVWITAAAFGVGIFLFIAGSRCFSANYGRRFSESRAEVGPWTLTAFQRLNFTADDVLECLSLSNKIIGMGATGTVYRAEMPGGEIIAVKKLWGMQKETRSNSNTRRKRGVLAEVDVLGNVRHRNIVRLLGCISNNECTMLLYEYMPNGNLDDLLHNKSKGESLLANWITRYNIALGVAQGICYLHHDCDPVIVHRDLKPSNILLDAEMEARVADFGVAKLIQSDESMSVIAGSYGYIAPEYAYTLQVDEKSDIYSYGVVLMELLSGKRSVDAEFGDGNSIVDWVRSKIKVKDGAAHVLDKEAGASCSSVREEMIQLMRIALLCTCKNPADRPTMRDVILMLHEARPQRKLLAPNLLIHDGHGENVKPAHYSDS
ncbi:hypothetical protein SAY86_016841 [Trapa natans]|uniref:non-specific serine/threonine protein kinase n=1 Tax=Trapa natans TaxID=22666 RepID=A0AAN7LPG8_TRANT|nr:hypothetical protein SAY86_016841 [Trapa natans]